LALAAVREGVLVTSYSMSGGLPDEKYVLSPEPDGWSVYFAERGRRLEERRFQTEAEACEDLFLRLRRDLTTRRF